VLQIQALRDALGHQQVLNLAKQVPSA
jgi:hypothetical protein